MQACPVGVSILTRLVGLGVLIFLLIFFFLQRLHFSRKTWLALLIKTYGAPARVINSYTT